MPPTPPRESTSGRLLDHLRTAGTLSRVELAEVTGLTPATITNVIRTLLEAGLVEEVGRQYQNRGQPRRLLTLAADAWYAVGVHLDVTRTSVVVVDFTGRRVATSGLGGTGALEPGTAIAALEDHIRGLLAGADIPLVRVLGIGLAVQGPVGTSRGTLTSDPRMNTWRDFPLADDLGARLGRTILMENDAIAATLFANWSGTVPSDSFCTVFVASGVGASVVSRGVPYRGAGGHPVEIGHVPVCGSDVPCTCGGRGCLEAVAGPIAVVRAALEDPDLTARAELSGRAPDALADFERLARATRADDPAANALLAASARHLGEAAATLVTLFDVNTVVLDGPAFATAGVLYRDIVAETLRTRALGGAERAFHVDVATTLDHSAAAGAALKVLRTVPVHDGVAR